MVTLGLHVQSVDYIKNVGQVFKGGVMRQAKTYRVRCPECGPKGTALISGNNLEDAFCMFVDGCFCELTAVPQIAEPAPFKQSKAVQRHAAMLERCLAASVTPEDFMFGEPYGDEKNLP